MFYLPEHRPEAARLKAEVETADAAEEGADAEGHFRAFFPDFFGVILSTSSPIMTRPAITRPATTRHPEGVRSTITPRRSVTG